MKPLPNHPKIRPQHLERKAVVYLRQSSDRQVRENLESQRLQYALQDQARQLGWKQVEVIDRDLGCSAAAGAAPRRGFDQVIASVARGEVGIVMSREVSRLSRRDKDWCQLLEVCHLFGTLLGDAEQIYDLKLMDDQLVLGIKGTLSVVELKFLKMRLVAETEEKARRGELVRLLPPGYLHDALQKVVKDPDQRVREAIELVFRKFGLSVQQSDPRRVGGPGDAQAQTRLMGHSKLTPPLPGHHPRRGPQPGPHSQPRPHPGHPPPHRRQPRQRRHRSGPPAQAKVQVQHLPLPETLPLRSPRPPTLSCPPFCQIPQRTTHVNLKGRVLASPSIEINRN